MNEPNDQIRPSTEEERERAVAQFCNGDDDIQIDVDAKVAEIDDSENIWVQAWVLVQP